MCKKDILVFTGKILNLVQYGEEPILREGLKVKWNLNLNIKMVPNTSGRTKQRTDGVTGVVLM